ncbi:MAG: type II secretion system protein, partial [bacterium]
MVISKQKSFTLIELLVVIAILGLLVSIVLVSLQDAEARARDGKRDAEAGEVGGTLRKTMEVYHS